MMYYLFRALQGSGFPGASLFNFITFRAAAAFLLSMIISLVFGRRIINALRRKQVGETIRDLGLEGQVQKAGTPTMGGLIILLAVLVPTLLFARVGSVYIALAVISTIWLGAIGFLDDYIKVFKKKKAGLAGKFKLVGQVGLGIIVGTTLYLSPEVVVRKHLTPSQYEASSPEVKRGSVPFKDKLGDTYYTYDERSMKATIPFLKNHELDYAAFLRPFQKPGQDLSWIIYIPICILIITAVSNGANLTDGLDGLAAGVSAIIVFTLAAFAFVSGNRIIADYLNIMYLPNVGELVVFNAALIGGCVGFLWFNAYPAQVFMGDTGSLFLGGLIAVLALMVRKELLIPLLCGVFLVENLSVIIQVSYFKYTKRKFGEGRRVFRMSPLHHHYQKLGYHESKIVARFWIVGVFLAILSIITLKLR